MILLFINFFKNDFSYHPTTVLTPSENDKWHFCWYGQREVHLIPHAYKKRFLIIISDKQTFVLFNYYYYYLTTVVVVCLLFKRLLPLLRSTSNNFRLFFSVCWLCCESKNIFFVHLDKHFFFGVCLKTRHNKQKIMFYNERERERDNKTKTNVF